MNFDESWSAFTARYRNMKFETMSCQFIETELSIDPETDLAWLDKRMLCGNGLPAYLLARQWYESYREDGLTSFRLIASAYDVHHSTVAKYIRSFQKMLNNRGSDHIDVLIEFSQRNWKADTTRPVLADYR